MREDGERMNEGECDAAVRPVDRQECKKITCPAEVRSVYDASTKEKDAIWMTGAWTRVSFNLMYFICIIRDKCNRPVMFAKNAFAL